MEALGIIASLLVLISFLFNDIIKIRVINIIGCIIFVIYGIMINSFSVWFLNSALLIVHIYHLIRDKKEK